MYTVKPPESSVVELGVGVLEECLELAPVGLEGVGGVDGEGGGMIVSFTTASPGCMLLPPGTTMLNGSLTELSELNSSSLLGGLQR